MARIRFTSKKFKSETLKLIELCDRIITDYQGQGMDLTVRQLYYQLVSRDYIENTQNSYSRIAAIINDARMAGMIDWEAIVDRGRKTITPSSWDRPSDLIRKCSEIFRLDKWVNQDVRVEVMCEKQALEGVFAPVCNAYSVPFTSNKGYGSQSLLYRKGQEIAGRMEDDGKLTVVLYFGDHDPSGLDMDRDLDSRLKLFAGIDPADNIQLVHRISLSMEQIEEFDPPPNPAKLTDSRADEYIRKHGHHSWELDAMEPTYLRGLLAKKIEVLLDMDKWEAMEAQEDEMKIDILHAAERMEG